MCQDRTFASSEPWLAARFAVARNGPNKKGRDRVKSRYGGQKNPKSCPGLRAKFVEGKTGKMNETRKLAAILAADVVGYSRLAGADEDRILARLQTLRSDLIDPTIAVHKGRVVKRTGDGALV